MDGAGRWRHLRESFRRYSLHLPGLTAHPAQLGLQDLATYKLLGSLSSLEIAEISARSGASCGSLFLDLRFRALLAHLLARHPAHLDGPSLANFMHAFAEGDKLLFRGGERDDQTWWRFACFNQEDPDDVSCGLVRAPRRLRSALARRCALTLSPRRRQINGEVAIQGIVLRQEVFDPVIDQVRPARSTCPPPSSSPPATESLDPCSRSSS